MSFFCIPFYIVCEFFSSYNIILAIAYANFLFLAELISKHCLTEVVQL